MLEMHTNLVDQIKHICLLTQISTQISMVEQQDGGEEEGGKVGAPEEDVELQPREVEGEERDEREDELGQVRPRDLAEVQRQEARVEVRAVEHARPEVRQEEDEVPVVSAMI